MPRSSRRRGAARAKAMPRRCDLGLRVLKCVCLAGSTTGNASRAAEGYAEQVLLNIYIYIFKHLYSHVYVYIYVSGGGCLHKTSLEGRRLKCSDFHGIYKHISI